MAQGDVRAKCFRVMPRRIEWTTAFIRAEGTPSLPDFRHALREVARCCIHGVDHNPMAVELTKVALWIETVDLVCRSRRADPMRRRAAVRLRPQGAAVLRLSRRLKNLHWLAYLNPTLRSKENTGEWLASCSAVAAIKLRAHTHKGSDRWVASGFEADLSQLLRCS